MYADTVLLIETTRFVSLSARLRMQDLQAIGCAYTGLLGCRTERKHGYLQIAIKTNLLQYVFLKWFAVS